MYRHHRYWGNPRRGWDGPFVGRRTGYPLLGGLGGFGLGGGGGLMGDLLAGGVGYLIGKNSAQNQQQYPPQHQQPVQGSAGSVQSDRLARLTLLGQLRAQGTLTEHEFQAEKQKILNGY